MTNNSVVKKTIYRYSLFVLNTGEKQWVLEQQVDLETLYDRGPMDLETV